MRLRHHGSVIDWSLATSLAGLIAGEPGETAPASGLDDLARDAEARVGAYTGLVPATPIPAAETVDRHEWIAASAETMGALLDPALRSAGAGLGPLAPVLRVAAGAVLTAEVGVILGFLSQRVLGQYDLVLLEGEGERREPRLLFVEPNLGAAARSFSADEREVARWVALHEVTHALQFAGVPWLRGHLAGLVRELLGAVELRVDTARALRLPGPEDLRRLVAAVREADIVSLAVRERERETLARMQAVMSVVEGHAEHVMDAVGAEVLPSLPALRDAMERRRRSASAPARLLGRLLGLELKLRQYEQGKRFCDTVVETGGMAALNRVWAAPEALPTQTELERPGDWLARVAAVPV